LLVTLLDDVEGVFDEPCIGLRVVGDEADNAVWETSFDAENRCFGDVGSNGDTKSSLRP
jgi:hypothetical protein